MIICIFLDQIANIHWLVEKARKLQKNIYFCFIDYAKPLTAWITKSYGKILRRWEYQTTLPASWETCIQVKKQQLEPDMEHWTNSKLGKEYVTAVYCYPAYLTYTQSTSCEMPGWVRHKMESRLLGEISRLLGEISIASDTQMTHHPYGGKRRATKEPLDEGERGE